MLFPNHMGMFQPVNSGQDLGNGLIQYLRDFFPQFNTLIQRLREGLVLHERDMVLPRNLTYFVGQITGPLRDQFRRLHLFFPLVTQGYGKMRRVGDDNIRLRDLFHHPSARHFTLHLPDPRLNQRVSFTLFHFVLNFLLRHLQVFFVLPALEGIIKNSQDNQYPACSQQYLETDGKGKLQNFRNRKDDQPRRV